MSLSEITMNMDLKDEFTLISYSACSDIYSKSNRMKSLNGHSNKEVKLEKGFAVIVIFFFLK